MTALMETALQTKAVALYASCNVYIGRKKEDVYLWELILIRIMRVFGRQ